jgi:hypothetical protein
MESPWASEPFFAETVQLLSNVRDHDFDSLAALCDDDFGIVDLDQSGSSVMVRTRADWEAWFHRLFSELSAVNADTDSEILNYQALQGTDMGFSVVEFRQSLTMGDAVGLFDCVATIVWKLTDAGWREARWHVSLLSADIPEELVG